MTKQKLAELVCAECGTVGKMKKIKYVFTDVIYDNERSSVEGHVVPAGAPTHACRACGAEAGAGVGGGGADRAGGEGGYRYRSRQLHVGGVNAFATRRP